MRSTIRKLVGAGDRVIGLWLPVAIAGVLANVLWPTPFMMRFGTGGVIAGIVLLALGAPLWFTSVSQVLIVVPKGKLITTGPYALMFHPLYTSVAVLVLPGCGLLFDTWLGFVLGAVLYAASRIYSPHEERELAVTFGKEYGTYRTKVLLPWL